MDSECAAVPGLQRTVPLRFTLRCARDTHLERNMPARTRLPLGRDKAKVTARIPFGREVVTFSCGYWVGGVLPAGALNGGTDYDLSQDA